MAEESDSDNNRMEFSTVYFSFMTLNTGQKCDYFWMMGF